MKRPPVRLCIVVAYAAVIMGWRVLWLVAAVAMAIRSLTAPTAPETVAASFTLKRSEMKQCPRPELLAVAHLGDQVAGRRRRAGERVEAEFFEVRHGRLSLRSRDVRASCHTRLHVRPGAGRVRRLVGEPAAHRARWRPGR